MWLSKKWTKNTMLGGTAMPTSEKPLLNTLLKLRLGKMAFLSSEQKTPETIPAGGSEAAPCPPFLRRAFTHSVSRKDVSQLKELLIICDRNALGIPGELFSGIWSMYDSQLPYRFLFLQQSRNQLKFLSRHFTEFAHFSELKDPEHWNELTLTQKKVHLQSRFAWNASLTAFDWIGQLPSSERVELLEDNIFRQWPGRINMAEKWASSMSKKATAVANAYLLGDTKHQTYTTAIAHLREQIGFDQKIKLKDDALPFPLFESGISKDSSHSLLKMVPWMDPVDVFAHLDVTAEQLGIEIMHLDENEAWVAALLHGAIYHAREDWISYTLELVSYYDLVHVKYHDQWPTILQRIKPSLIMPLFEKSMRKAQNDLDRLDAIQHWLYPADIFMSKDLSEKLWSVIGTGIELLVYKQLPLQKYKGLSTYIQNRVHPGVDFSHVNTSLKTDFVSELMEEIRSRYILYKSLNEWRKRKQSN